MNGSEKQSKKLFCAGLLVDIILIPLAILADSWIKTATVELVEKLLS